MSNAPLPTRAEEAREAGQVAYEARFSEARPGCFVPWGALTKKQQAQWARIEHAVAVRAEAEVARLTERVAVLEGALKPFAIIADCREPIDKDRADNIACFSGLGAPLAGHFRAARTALHGGDHAGGGADAP